MSVIPADTERLAQLLRELEDLNIASEIVESKLQTETRLAGNRLYEAVKPEVTRLGKKFAEAFRALHAAHLDFDQYASKLEVAGGNVSMLRIRPNGLSHPMDPSSNYSFGLREFIDAGFFSTNDMPKAFK
jgi:hypothetical protein